MDETVPVVAAVDGAVPGERVTGADGAGAGPGTVLLGAALLAAGAGWRAVRPLAALPVGAARLATAVTAGLAPRTTEVLVRRGRAGRVELAALTDAVLRLVVVRVLAVLRDSGDLTELVRDGVDLDAVAAGLDADAVVARVDLDAIVRRLDLVTIAREVVDAIDLPDIIRHSTGALTSESVRTVRSEARNADDVVAGVVDRLLGRSRTGATGSPTR